ncbi:solute carrier-like protein, partial [Leptotrombidium deliense]
SSKINTESVCKHLLLKTIAFTIATPFFCSSCIETVQSSVASETPGIFDCLKEGLVRFTYWRRSNSTRLLPFWVITGPTITYHVLHYAISSITKSVIVWSKSKTEAKKENSSCSELSDVSSTVIGTFVADILLFPLETIIFRLYLQGTRTLVDSVDQTNRVIPIISDYEGPIDCYKNIVAEEGSAGLFKGFGSLVLQYVFHFAILKVTNVILREILPNNKKVDN